MKSLTITHVSDSHSRAYPIPEADLYVFTGDLLPDYMVRKAERRSLDRELNRYWLDNYATQYVLDKAAQGQYVAENAGKWREKWGIGDQPVVVCRGNHDWHDLAPLFGGEVYEMGLQYTEFRILNLKIGGQRGVLPINGFWSDEFDESHFDTSKYAPDLDILVTHQPPKGYLADVYGRELGSLALRDYAGLRLVDDAKVPLLHCYGHVHESYGLLTREHLTFSNAACHYNEIEIEK